MLRQDAPNSRDGQSAFTIIEVLIVLAVAGLIILIVFFAVPAFQRNQRNTSRKQFIGQVHAALEEYALNNDKKYPSHLEEFCDFIDKSSIRSINPGMEPCEPSLDSSVECVLVRGGLYDICYHIHHSANDYIGPYDQVNIQSSHWCGDDPSNTSQYPITDGGSNAVMLAKYAIWTPLENTGVACIGTD